MRPTISSYDSYNYNAARFLANLLTAATPEARSYIKDSFDFADKIRQNKNIYGLMFSLDVTALFTNVSLEKAIPIAIKKIRKYQPDLAINDENLNERFKFCTMKTNFAFNNENYDQINGVSMDSLLAPILAHLFMSDLENQMQNYKKKRPELYYRYEDDIFAVLHGNQKDIGTFLKFMNKIEPSIKFNIEMQSDSKLPFLDVMVERTEKDLITYVYMKPTDTGLYLKWISNQPRNYKINLIKCLCIRAKRICSTDTLFKEQIEYYKRIFMVNGYPLNIIKKTIRSVEYGRSNTNIASSTNIEIYISMPYYGALSNILANKIKNLLKIKNKNKNIIFGFKAGYRLSSIFR